MSSFAGWLEVKFGDVQHFLHGLQKWSQCQNTINLYFSLMSSRGRLCCQQKCDFWSLSKVFLGIGCFSLTSRCCSLVSERFQRSVFELWIIPVLCRHSWAKSCIFGLFVISSLSHKHIYSPFFRRIFKKFKDNTVKQHKGIFFLKNWTLVEKRPENNYLQLTNLKVRSLEKSKRSSRNLMEALRDDLDLQPIFCSLKPGLVNPNPWPLTLASSETLSVTLVLMFEEVQQFEESAVCTPQRRPSWCQIFKKVKKNSLIICVWIFFHF